MNAQLEQQLARLRAIGWRDALKIEATTWSRLLKSTLAATLAWEAGVLMDSPRPMLASLGALLVVQVTVRATFKRTLQLTVAVIFGLVVALLLGHVLGLHWWSIGLVILGALVVGEVLRLGPLSNQAALSGLLALSFGSAYGYQRVVDTAVGALIGIAVNGLIAPPSLVKEAAQALKRVGEDLGALLEDIGTGLKQQPDRPTVEKWLTRAREIAGALRKAEDAVNQAEESLSLNPLRAKTDEAALGRVAEARLALEHVISQARGFVRTLLDITKEEAEPAPPQVFQAIGGVLTALGPAVTAFGRLQENPSADGEREAARTARDRSLTARRTAATEVQQIAGHAHGLRLAALLVDAQRLLDEVDIDGGAHAEAVAPSE